MDFDAAAVVTDGHGNITAMPELIGRPCFGIVTAFLRYGSKEPVRSKRLRSPVPSRCARCKAGSACGRVAKERIRALDLAHGVLRGWHNKGGRSVFASLAAMHDARSIWTRIVQAARTAQFTNSNDDIVRSYWDGLEARERARDARRKQVERRKARAEGVIDQDLMDQVVIERERRSLALTVARLAPRPLHWISKLDDRSANIVASAWAARYLVTAAKKKMSAGRVAKEIIERGWVSGLTEASLRQRLPRDFERVDTLEKQARAGTQIWEPFKPR